MKTCKTCNIDKSEEDYYKLKSETGRLNSECKECTKARTKQNYKAAMSNPEIADKRRAHWRKRYHEFGYNYVVPPEKERARSLLRSAMFPEKKKARSASQHIQLSTVSNTRHHWSYNEIHWKDIIELSLADHSFLHRYIVYDQERFMFRRTTDNVLLDTKEKHLEWWAYIQNNFER